MLPAFDDASHAIAYAIIIDADGQSLTPPLLIDAIRALMLAASHADDYFAAIFAMP